jgi:hypothetical protein
MAAGRFCRQGHKSRVGRIEKVDHRDAYKLKLTLQNGLVRRLGIDAQTFLDIKVDGAPRRLDGRYHPVYTYMRDYQQVEGLMVP